MKNIIKLLYSYPFEKIKIKMMKIILLIPTQIVMELSLSLSLSCGPFRWAHGDPQTLSSSWTPQYGLNHLWSQVQCCVWLAGIHFLNTCLIYCRSCRFTKKSTLGRIFVTLVWFIHEFEKLMTIKVWSSLATRIQAYLDSCMNFGQCQPPICRALDHKIKQIWW